MVDDSFSLAWEDWIVIGFYFAFVFGLGIWASLRAVTDNSQGYFLAGQNTGWLLLGCSTFATNIGAHMFVGLAGSGASRGIAVVMFEWHAMFMLIALGWLFLPVYRASGCFTMPQYLQLRYGGGRIRLTIAIIHTLLTIISSISGQMYVGALFLDVVFNWNLYASIGLILAITVIYTAMGGLSAVIWTDFFATLVLIAGALASFGYGLDAVGGFEPMRNQYMESAANYTRLHTSLYGNHSCGWVPDDAFHIFKPADDPSYPWPGMVFGLTILATNAWCTDQICVQRSLSAKSVSHAKGGVLLAAYLKILPFIFFIIPGMIARVLYPEEIACADPDECTSICYNEYGCGDISYPLLVAYLLPAGLRGLMLAGLIAALMSSLTSQFNSSSTLVTLDIWKYFRTKASEKECMIVGRVWTLIMACIALAWMPILLAVQGTSFWDYTQSISSHINPPIVAAFVCGMFWPRATEQGAFWAIIIGLVIGMTRQILDWVTPGAPCGSTRTEEYTQWAIISDVHYLHFAIILFTIAVIIIVCVSYVTKPRPPAQLRRVTFWTRNDPRLQEIPDKEDDDEDQKDKNLQESINDHQNKEKFKVDGEEEAVADEEGKKPGVGTYMKSIFCGITAPKKPMTKEEILERQLKLTNIKEDPYWKKVLGINAIVCAAVAVFLHAFWA